MLNLHLYAFELLYHYIGSNKRNKDKGNAHKDL